MPYSWSTHVLACKTLESILDKLPVLVALARLSQLLSHVRQGCVPFPLRAVHDEFAVAGRARYLLPGPTGYIS